MTRRSLIAPDAVIFDFDLTLVDSRPGFVASHRYAAECMGVPAPAPEAIERAIGTPLELVVPGLFPEMPEAAVVEYIRLYRAKADEIMAGLTVVLPGAAETVAHLKAGGLKLAIVSQKLRRLVSPVLQREGFDIDVVLGAEDVPAFEPDPGGLLLALERLGVDAEGAIYVGDTTIDAEAAANAGLRFVGVLTGPTGRDAFSRHPSLGLLESVRELPEFLAV
jgi:phosphoglycolate phosphatase